MSTQDRRNGGKWSLDAMESVTAGHNKFDALELRILLYIYFKPWDLRGDLLYMSLSDQFRDLCVPSVWCCPHCDRALASRGFGSFSVEL